MASEHTALARVYDISTTASPVFAGHGLLL